MNRVGLGFDAHRFEPGRPLVLGGVRIEHNAGLAGHSDADVLAHAIADALLGSVALGDIGTYFPDTDPRWKDADSLKLLENVAEMVVAKGAVILNVDATVMAEEPRLAPHVSAMRENLGASMKIAPEFVSVKATTVERMGALGRGEGIAVMAVACVEQEPRENG